MKKPLLILLAISLLQIINLQAQFKYGFRAGISANTMTLKAGGVGLDPKTIVGYHAGFTAELTLTDQFSIQPAVLIASKGSNYTLPGTGNEIEFKPTFIEVPINGLLKLKFNSVKFLAFTGLYMSYGVGGSVSLLENSEENTEDLTFGDGIDKHMKPFDSGLNFGTGLQVRRTQLTVQYNLGLANLSPVTENNMEMKTRSVTISLGFLIK